jgi:hypothetical protein
MLKELHLALQVIGASYLIVYGVSGLVKLVKDAIAIAEAAIKHYLHLK